MQNPHQLGHEPGLLRDTLPIQEPTHRHGQIRIGLLHEIRLKCLDEWTIKRAAQTIGKAHKGVGCYTGSEECAPAVEDNEADHDETISWPVLVLPQGVVVHRSIHGLRYPVCYTRFCS